MVCCQVPSCLQVRFGVNEHGHMYMQHTASSLSFLHQPPTIILILIHLFFIPYSCHIQAIYSIFALTCHLQTRPSPIVAPALLSLKFLMTTLNFLLSVKMKKNWKWNWRMIYNVWIQWVLICFIISSYWYISFHSTAYLLYKPKARAGHGWRA